VPYGATLTLADGNKVKAGQQLATGIRSRDPSSPSTRARSASRTSRRASTVAKQIDETTGLSSLVVIDPKRRGTSATKGLRPAVKLIGPTARK
jgi:DNA-directed RNA polymerase subunit beta'